MGDGPVAERDARDRPSWKLTPRHAALTQGLVVSGFASQQDGAALFLEFGWPDGAKGGQGAWLRTLAEIAPVTAADGPTETPAALAFTCSGLWKMGLDDAALDSFAAPFREGMCEENRLRRLGDRQAGAWLKSVIDGGLNWSGNTEPPADTACEDIPRVIVRTPCTVHAMLLIYGKDTDTVKIRARAIETALARHDVAIVRTLPLSVRRDENGIDREHFGFADGISQPVPYEDGVVVYGDGTSVPKDHWHGVRLGEILVGHVNAYNEIAPVPAVQMPREYVRSEDPLALKEEGAPEGCLNFGVNGSYMVVRELRQHVADFWESLDRGCARIRERDPVHSGNVTAEWLAERVIGRNRDGDLLCPAGPLPKDCGQPDNAFGFIKDDPQGLGCPRGSHVRRANPRDSLARSADDGESLLGAANNHRLLRRGRKFGKDVVDPRKEDHEDRGLLFICLNADITRQFEFVQQTWLLNKNFHTLFDETDPLLGPAGTMTISEQPLRRRIEVETFVQCAGGEYFFLPSMPALAYLAAQ